jgi:hypothetical protein
LRTLCERLGREIYEATFNGVASSEMNRVGTLFAIAFYVEKPAAPEAIVAVIDDAAIEIVERLLGMLSFLAGVRLVAEHTQTAWVKDDGGMSSKLEPMGRPGVTRAPFELPEDPLGGRPLQPNIFIALFWLRRALAERDPLDTYAAFMVSLQAIAREVVTPTPLQRRCSECGHVRVEDPGATALVRELVVEKLGSTPDQFARLWRARNALVAHGNQAVDAGSFVRLTELKFEAAMLCYKGIKLALGLPTDGPPNLDVSFFATSALMYVE